MQNQPAIFEDYEIRRVYDDATETWWFSVVDIIQVLTQQADYQTARKYWNKLKGLLANPTVDFRQFRRLARRAPAAFER